MNIHTKKNKKFYYITIIILVLAFNITFHNKVFADDQQVLEKLSDNKYKISQWIDFKDKLGEAKLLPKSITNLCNEIYYDDNYNVLWWNDSSTVMSLFIMADFRAEQLIEYSYKNYHGNNFIEEINPIDNNQAVEKVIKFLEIYNISTDDWNKLSKNDKIKNIVIEKIEQSEKSPNYNLSSVSIKYGEKDQYYFTVDMNMGGIIYFKNGYIEQLAENDVRVGGVEVVNGKTFEKKLKADQTFLWINNKNKEVKHLEVKQPDYLYEEFYTRESLMEMLSQSKSYANFTGIPDFNTARVVYYLTPENVDYTKPIKSIKVEDGIYFNVYDLKGDYRKNVLDIYLLSRDSEDNIGVSFRLTNDDPEEQNDYRRIFNYDFKISSIGSNNIVETKENSKYNEQLKEIAKPFKHSYFDIASINEDVSNPDDAFCYIGAVKKIEPIVCYDFYSFGFPEIIIYTGREVSYSTNNYKSIETIKNLFKQSVIK